MPSKSKSQQRLFAAAEHNASFPKARALRDTMTLGQLSDFASGSMQGKPERVKSGHPHQNLGKYLHPKRGR